MTVHAVETTIGSPPTPPTSSDLLPAFVLAGIGFGFCGPAVQLGALTGVSRSEAGLASGLVETMGEIGGAAGVAIVSTVLGAAVAAVAFARTVPGDGELGELS